MNLIIKVIRLKEHWKDLFILIPSLLTFKFNLDLIKLVLLSFLITSSGYIINDLIDKDKDYVIKYNNFIKFLLIFLISTFFILYFTFFGFNFIYLLIFLVILSNYILYSYFFVKVYGLDIIALGLNYFFRGLLGYLAINEEISFYLLLSFLFFGAYLNLEKRYAKFVLKKKFFTEEDYEKTIYSLRVTIASMSLAFFNIGVIEISKSYIILIPFFIILILRSLLLVRKYPEYGLKSYKIFLDKFNFILITTMIFLVVFINMLKW